jgi:hypothetical protein
MPSVRTIALAALALLALPGAAAARQIIPPPPDAPHQSGFLTRADYYFEWASLLADDVRFDWEADIGFDLDVADYGRGRVYFRGDYQGVLGRERRRYDLNQGTYFFAAGGTLRAGATEVIGLLTHVSRHVVDRDNQPSISWNTIGARVRHHHRRGGTTFDGEIGIARAMQQAYVDYQWTSDVSLTVRRKAGAGRGLFATATGGVIGINHDISTRPRICGGRLEGGYRVDGHAADIELFAGYERRMDAYPTDRFRVRMWTIGFRITR